MGYKDTVMSDGSNMAIIGEIIRGDKIGRRSNDYYAQLKCPECLEERWVLRWKMRMPSFTGLCRRCSTRRNRSKGQVRGVNHPRWNNGQTMSRGYVYIANPEHPTCTSKGYVKRARLVLEAKLGRLLLPNCVPHHINGIKHDDRDSNLIELTKSQHARLHLFERRLKANGKSIGIQKVVDWIEAHSVPRFFNPDLYQLWQAFLKEVEK